MSILPLPTGPGPFESVSAFAREPIVAPDAGQGAATRHPGEGPGSAVAAPAPATPKLWFSPGCPPNMCPACHRKREGKLTVGKHSRGVDGLVCEMAAREDKRLGAKRPKMAAADVSGEVDAGAPVAIAGAAAATSAGEASVGAPVVAQAA